MSKPTITASAYFDDLLASKKISADVDRYLSKVFRVGTIEIPLTDLEIVELHENMVFALALKETFSGMKHIPTHKIKLRAVQYTGQSFFQQSQIRVSHQGKPQRTSDPHILRVLRTA
jgi:hypothetical protein